MIMVFQLKNFADSLRQSKATRITVRQKIEDYHLVAKVLTNDLDRAYELTNTIDQPWWIGPSVVFHGSPDHGMDGCRSTSMGDLLVRSTDHADGTTSYESFIVAMCGFTKLQEV